MIKNQISDFFLVTVLDQKHEKPTTPPSPKALQIIEAASKLFLGNGFGSVSMDAIARHAKVSKPTLYSHFQDKETLFSEIMNTMCENAGSGQVLETLEEENGPPQEVLRNIGRTKLDLVLNWQGLSLARIVFAETTRFPSLGQTFWETGPKQYYDALEIYLARLDDEGVLEVPNPATSTMKFDGMLMWGFIFPLLLGVVPLPTEREIHDHVDGVVDDFLRIHAVSK